MKRAIKNHRTDFIAICVLVVLAVVVSGYVLSHERLQLPFRARCELPLAVSARTHDLEMHKVQRHGPDEEPDDQDGDDRHGRPREEQPAAV